MPFFAHPDLLLTYGRSWQIAFNGASLVQFSQPIPHILQAVWLKFLGVFTGAEFFQPLIVSRPSTLTNYAMMTDFVTANSAPQLNIFLFKFLYLLIDILAVYLIWRWFVKPMLKKTDAAAKAKLLVSLYWLNPVLIFAVYVFGRYEVIPALLLILVLWLLKEQKFLVSSFVMGLLFVARSSFIILVPIFLLLNGKKWWEKVVAGMWTLLPYMMVQILKPAGFATENVSALTSGSHAGYLTQTGVIIEDIFQLKWSFFIIAYAILAYAAWQFYLKMKAQQKAVEWQHTALFFTLTLVIFYATSFYHPHYLAWVVVPLVFTVKEFKLWQQLKYLLLAVTLLLPLLLLTWGRDMWMGLFIPLSVELGNKDLAGVIGNFMDPVQFNSIIWSLMAAVWLMIGWVVWRNSEAFTNKKDKN